MFLEAFWGYVFDHTEWEYRLFHATSCISNSKLHLVTYILFLLLWNRQSCIFHLKYFDCNKIFDLWRFCFCFCTIWKWLNILKLPKSSRELPRYRRYPTCQNESEVPIGTLRTQRFKVPSFHKIEFVKNSRNGRRNGRLPWPTFVYGHVKWAISKGVVSRIQPMFFVIYNDSFLSTHL